MKQNDDFQEGAAASGINRYVPLLIYAIVILTFLCIPLKSISYGYLPPDDALRHAAKAVSGKPWSEILVLGDTYKVDHNFGWHLVLRQIYLWSHCDTETLVVFSVVALFTLVGWSAVPWLRRPEAWLATTLLFAICTESIERHCLGRPFLLTMSTVLTFLFLWQSRSHYRPGWRTALGMTVLITIAVFVHGVWYLWLLPIAAFVLAREFEWALVLAGSWIVGTLFAAALTGHPVDYLWGALYVAIKGMGAHLTQRTLATELQPDSGDFPALVLVAGLLVLRNLAKLDVRPLTRNPAFWLACVCWVLGFKARRFWGDWGWPALMVLVAWDLQTFLQTRLPPNSLKRLAWTGALAVATFLGTTNDRHGRWTNNLTTEYLTQEDPQIVPWLPEKGGILYSADMRTFYRTFYKNPNADWRYMVGYEPVIMPPEDFNTYHRILWNFNDCKAYEPWVKKLRPQDRLLISGVKGARPDISQLEWNYTVSGTWLGRLPRTNSAPQISSSPKDTASR
jgi:hypothetical protein